MGANFLWNRVNFTLQGALPVDTSAPSLVCLLESLTNGWGYFLFARKVCPQRAKHSFSAIWPLAWPTGALGSWGQLTNPVLRTMQRPLIKGQVKWRIFTTYNDWLVNGNWSLPELVQGRNSNGKIPYVRTVILRLAERANVKNQNQNNSEENLASFECSDSILELSPFLRTFHKTEWPQSACGECLLESSVTSGKQLRGGRIRARCVMEERGHPKSSITISLLSMELNFWFIRWDGSSWKARSFSEYSGSTNTAAGNHVPSNECDFEPLSRLQTTECLCLELPTPFLIHMQVSSSLSSYRFLWVSSSFQIPSPLCSLTQWPL